MDRLRYTQPAVNSLKLRVGEPKAAKRPRTERAIFRSTLNALRFECLSTEDLPQALRPFDRLRVNSPF